MSIALKPSIPQVSVRGAATAVLCCVLCLPAIPAHAAPDRPVQHGGQRTVPGRHLELGPMHDNRLQAPDLRSRTGRPRPLDGFATKPTSATPPGANPADPPNAAAERLRAFSIRWQSEPEIVQQARMFRRRGLPIVHLWESNHALVAIGLNRRGVPGIYVTQPLKSR